MEEWFHDWNDKEEVNNARPLIGEVLKMVQSLSPREEKSNGNCIPKIHGMTKFQPYMKRYGSAINFYGGPGKAAHKYFVKAPGQKTQCHVSKFAVQTANQCYYMMVTKHAMSSIGMEMERIVIQRNNNEIDCCDIVADSDEISVAFSGKYSLVVRNDILECMKRNDNIYVFWTFDKKI
jgi:hypothetical protein